MQACIFYFIIKSVAYTIEDFSCSTLKNKKNLCLKICARLKSVCVSPLISVKQHVSCIATQLICYQSFIYIISNVLSFTSPVCFVCEYLFRLLAFQSSVIFKTFKPLSSALKHLFFFYRSRSLIIFSLFHTPTQYTLVS